MSRQEAEQINRARARANTTSFLSWRKQRTEHPPSAQPALSLEALIQALSPPSVPSLAHARALASALSNCSPLPRRDILNPILDSLCNDAKSPPSVQAAGYDILSAYWENHEALPLAVAERLSYFSLFLGATTPWGVELWEPRFKALRALTKYGTDIMGIEDNLIDILQYWIEGAFEGLMKPPSSIDRSETAERERSVDIIVKFLSDILTRPENISRITDDKMASVLGFYASLVDRCIVLPDASKEPTSPTPSSASASNGSTSKPSQGHRRNLSSLSTSSTPSVTSTPPQPAPTFKHPAEFATTLYLNHLSAHIKVLPPTYLNSILPLLFRALAFFASPLARLSVTLQSRKKNTLEDKITEHLNALSSGPYANMCMIILRTYLFPPNTFETPKEPRSPQPQTQLTQSQTLRTAVLTSLGANRTFRNYVRRALSARLARAYISREVSLGYSHSGAPGHMELQGDLMEKAWPKDDFAVSSVGIGGNGWDAARLGRVLADSVGAWVEFHFDDAAVKNEAERRVMWEKEREGKDEILEEAAGVLKDILQELDLRDDDNGPMDEDEASIVGLTLLKLSNYVLPLKNQDGSPFIIPISHPNDAPTPILRTISSLLARDHSRALNPLLSSILIHVAEHLTDTDTARLPFLMMDQQDLSPTSPEWLDNWQSLLGNETLVSPCRPQTRRAVMDTLQMVYDGVKDMTTYRRPLGDLVWTFCGGLVGRATGVQSDDADVMWKMVGEEVVLRSSEQAEDDEEGAATVSKFLELLVSVASEKQDGDEEGVETASIHTSDTSTAMPSASPVSPSQTRPDMPSVMSILSSLTSGSTPSRSQSQSAHPQPHSEPRDHSASASSTPLPLSPPIPRDVSAASALVEIFSQLTFTPFSLHPKNLQLALRVYTLLLSVVSTGSSPRARLAALQFLVRLRADRDHSVYFASDDAYDPNGLVASLGALINREGRPRMGERERERASEDLSGESADIRRARARFPQERDGRQASRGRGAGVNARSEPSRSRSRTAPPPLPPSKPIETLWHIPESLPFHVSGPDTPSEVLVSYDPEGPDRMWVLPISQYLQTICGILERETSWEVLSYILCHLPVQLSNKHLFCGPKSRAAVSRILSVLCTGILNGELGSHIEQWPTGLKARDAHGLAYQTLSVLISYRRCFDLQQRHLLVEVFQAGLNGQLPTIKCCLHGLSLSAFELQPSMTKCLSRILEKLSQIMSNPNMAAHILGFLSIIGSLPVLHANFTEMDYKMVFGVALQYLQHYNRLQSKSKRDGAAASGAGASPPPPGMSWALTQHVRILSYSAVYIWFLALKLPDRPRHIRYITRQLLLANEGNKAVDGPTEVCFDWLARYTYASADPRPANSIFSDIVLGPSSSANQTAEAQDEKTWVMGNSVLTIRALARSGWVEVMSRRPSGYSRFVCRVENVPMVGPGDVSPDLLSIPAGLIMERDPARPMMTGVEGEVVQDESASVTPTPLHPLSDIGARDEEETPQPDPITGYVWSGSAPSQRRKQVSVDPAFLFLQLSPFPDGNTEPYVKRVPDGPSISKFVASLDRIPVIDTHKVGIMYVAPGQSDEGEVLRNVHGSPAYTRFLEGLGRLINLRGQVDVYAGGLDPDEDGEYAYAWWDDIGQILYHTATMMPTSPDDPQCNNKKRHIGNDYVRIVWNDSGLPYRFDTLKTQFQFVNIVIEPHSLGSIAAFSNNIHENEYFKVTMQLAPGMTEFAPIGHFKLISAENLPLLVRQLSLLADWFASVFSETQKDTVQVETKTNWYIRLETIRRFKNQLPVEETLANSVDGVMGQEALRDFTTSF
ncbi:hypothetical protein GALMADRAFT_99986 [Galerina marginata CBS 339.88]|uniref:Rap-GAP domain-containing protein n=1 Tax=Galerina marginata (strain CBS 339.88) TaxID=685588 RepID=A0A067T541_GALM3|nr:hypothetical protein GALMADRAFT_99986 [Galerina marginata CBS 339.88]